MPEGDTIFRLAARMRPDLVDRVLTEVYLRERGTVDALVGDRVERVDSHGKHLLVTIDSGWVVRVHFGIQGRARRFANAQRPPTDEVGRLATDDTVWAFYRAPQVALVRTSRVEGRLASLGPDLLDEEVDLDAIVARARRELHDGQTIADLLLDQRVAAGIGNVYKNEVLFMRRASPFAKVRDCDDESLREMFRLSRKLMQQALKRGGKRITVPTRLRMRPGTPNQWVYRRTNKPCLECGTPIRRVVQGDQARATFYCPTCQTD